jgi:hypothetical protein
MKVYTIYEIPGVKIGCDADWPTRAHEQGINPEDCIVLQQETDLIQVSIDELWWQIEKGYPIDIGPYFVRVRVNKERAPKGGKIAGPLSVKNKTGWYGRSDEQRYKDRSRGGQKQGPKNVESGHFDNIRLLANKVNQEKISCKYCGKVCDRKNHGRWHGENCKKKPSEEGS